MNLFLGYYIPSHHFIPLWELENDYYLHNMQAVGYLKLEHQNLSVEWGIGDNDETDSNTNTPIDNYPDSVDSKNESFHISRVRKHCETQRLTRTFWWKDAIKSHLDQRRRLYHGYKIGDTVSQFHRIDKLTEFDKIFSLHMYEIPIINVRKSVLDEDKEQLQVHRNITSSQRTAVPDDDDDDSESHHNPLSELGGYLHQNDFSTKYDPLLSTFLESRTTSYRHRMASNFVKGMDSAKFVGEHDRDQKPTEEYTEYTDKPQVNPCVADFRFNRREELKRSLHESNLHADDVDGILKVRKTILRKEITGCFFATNCLFFDIFT